MASLRSPAWLLVGLLGGAACGADGTMGGGDNMGPMNPMKPPGPGPVKDVLPECPADISCDYVPAAYKPDGAGADSYGNYDLALRPRDGLDIRYIVIHDTEGSYESAVAAFEDPKLHAAAHYVIRSKDGHVTQMIATRNVAWHAGNWYVNMHSVGIEHEGIAVYGARWYTEKMYQASARLVRFLAQKYGVPLDRAHILGHDNVPGSTPMNQAGMHWDPGPFWDWDHFMDLVRNGAPASPDPPNDKIVVIRPDFARNQPTVSYCFGSAPATCSDLPRQGASFVYLRSAPDAKAPLLKNQYLPEDPTRANNWGDKAVAGQRFYLADHMGAWDAIYFDGQKAWFENPVAGGRKQNSVSGSGTLITPKAGLAAIPVYGRAYPEDAAYPPGIVPEMLEPNDTIAAGQVYVALEQVQSDFYSAPAYSPTLIEGKHTRVVGKTVYYEIFFNHRQGYVKAGDVDVRGPR